MVLSKGGEAGRAGPSRAGVAAPGLPVPREPGLICSGIARRKTKPTTS